MKKYAIIGLVFAALVFASCALKGGTIEVTNGSADFDASIAVYKGLVLVTDFQTATPGKKVTFSIEEDGAYTVNAIFSSTPPGHGSGEAVLLGGNKVKVSVTPTP